MKSPGFAFAALATLALGIGATTVVFSFVNGLLLRPLPFGEATSRIVSLHGTHPTQFPEDWDDAGVSHADLQDVGRESRILEDVAGLVERSFTLYGEETVRVSGASVTPNLFSLLSVTPAHGRDFRVEEGARIGFESVAILSDGLWRSRYGADPDIVGSTVIINERELTVIGIMPPGFRYPETKDLWVPYDPGEDTNRASRALLAVARLVPGASLDEARLEVETVANHLAERYPETNLGWSIYVLPYRDLVVRRDMRVVASSLLGAVGLVLLVGCANLASLLLARGTARHRELAMRSAMGASRGRLVRQMLVESLLLGGAGGLLGTLLALWGIDAVVSSFPEELPFWLSFDIDWRVAGFIVLLSVTTSIAFGLLPAFKASRIHLAAVLGSGRDPSAGRQALALQSGLIVGQVALSLALLVGASLMYRSFLNLTLADPGFDGGSLLTMRVYLAGDAYDPVAAKTAFFRDAVETIRSVPGVDAVTATTSIPADDGGAAARLVTPDHPVVDGNEIGVHVIGSTPGFFETLGTELLDGRPFEARDLLESASPVAIVNSSLAERLWPGTDATGHEVGIVGTNGIRWYRVIGVAPHIQYEEFGEETAQSALNVFVPYSFLPARGMAMLVRARGDAGALATPVREALRAFAPDLPVYLVRTMDEIRFMTTWQQRFFSHLFTGFAVAAVLLACLGVYGLIAYRVSLRTRELGIRIALGAEGRDVLRLLAGHGFVLAVLGVVIGVVLSFAVRGVLGSVVYGVPAGHIALLATTTLILLLPIGIATYLPARRAARIEPMNALRQE